MAQSSAASKPPATWPWPRSMDGSIAAPEAHHVVFENDLVRVVEVKIDAGERLPEHTHRLPSVVIVDAPARLRVRAGDSAEGDEGEPEPAEAPEAPGAPEGPRPSWAEPVGPHSVENIDDHRYHALRIELKVH
ncbi:hypothetical protein [Actinopolymorpha alba]|uniref:hypothetical protein n=1 Tax=Actinopolymorpha alba TaxID=533267 RepID=UPI000371A719|nr:hypothetical protein [Actinopolymorpha alba]